MSKILGLDLGTNSIGWAVVNKDDETGLLTNIVAAGSRIIPMDGEQMGNFSKGNSVSFTAERTKSRGVRRLRERALLRRQRHLRVMDVMDILPAHFAERITRYGKFKGDDEPKIAWRKDENGKMAFLFQDSFHEMLADFPQLKNVPYDWTLYYLRKKALTQKISEQELAWVLLSFNGKRGYNQLRGEEEAQQEDGKKKELLTLQVMSVTPTGEKKGRDELFDVLLSNGMVWRKPKAPKEWEGRTMDFVVTTEINEDGSVKSNKDGKPKISFRAPDENDWTLVKLKTENTIAKSGKTVGEFIYDTLCANPQQKIIGQTVRTIERKFYKEEMRLILDSQKRFHPKLNDMDLYARCAEELYRSNAVRRNILTNRQDFTHLFVDDITFYQRPLKSKKSEIADCPYESRNFTFSNGKAKKVKCIAKSNPLFSEFRLWQFLSNLRIYQIAGLEVDPVPDEGKGSRLRAVTTEVDVTAKLLNTDDKWVDLFLWLNDRADVDQKALLASPAIGIAKKEVANYRWNYVPDKSYPCNGMRGEVLKRLKKVGIDASFLSGEAEMWLWHILYSVEDKDEIRKALATYAKKNGLPLDFVDAIAGMPPFKKEYGAYSERAIRKMLPLLRRGRLWSADAIDEQVKMRIDDLCNGVENETLSDDVREKFVARQRVEDYQGLNVWEACYVVYNRHSEAADLSKWSSPDDIDAFLADFRQHSLRNPIVESVILETMRTVRDVWRKYAFDNEMGSSLSEIHVELGREMKNPADKRKMMTESIQANENANIRAEVMLMELMNPDADVEGVRPYSPSQREIFRIYEDGVLNNPAVEVDPDIRTIITNLSQTDAAKRPSHRDVLKYKCWLEQRYVSPYTGRIIPLGKLFTPAYEIEHVIPQSRYFDDSYGNKVICESEVNKLKDRMLGMEFIKKCGEQKVPLSLGGEVAILNEAQYRDLVVKTYRGAKQKNLLAEDIPDGFINRQLNDSRYISRFVLGLLSNIVREENEQMNVSKNIVACNGNITTVLKNDWGLNDVWNRIILPRFERMNEMTESSQFTSNVNGNVIPAMPIEFKKGFQKKRIDHRHHAMDAIVIACASRDHVHLLNNEAAMSKHVANRRALQKKLRVCETVTRLVDGEKQTLEVVKDFIKPWGTFTQDAEAVLRSIVVSFKQNLRVINKTSNKYEHYNEDGKKVRVKQTKGTAWAIRRSLHKDTVSGLVDIQRVKDMPLAKALEKPERIVNKDLRKKCLEMLAQEMDTKKIVKFFKDECEAWADVDVKKVAVRYFTSETNEPMSATRKDVSALLAECKPDKVDEVIDSITDTGIQAILRRHLEACGGDPAKAFSPEGVEALNANIVELNNGKKHQPIRKVRKMETLGNKFAVGQTGAKRMKFAEADKGTNLIALFYESADGRIFVTPALNDVVDSQKMGGKDWLPVLDEKMKKKGNVVADAKLLFHLAVDDVVYLPHEGEDVGSISRIDKSRLYKFVSASGTDIYFRSLYVANVIVNKYEFGPLNKSERAYTKEQIKKTCVPVRINRTGTITHINGREL